MRNKLILFLMLALFGSTSFLRADEVTVGSLEGATSDTYLPMNSLYNYSYTQQIYTAEEIGMAGTINSITMWMYGTATLPARTFDIYLKEVDKETFTGNTDWVTLVAGDMVYSGTVTFQNTSPAIAYTFTLDTPFQYSGEHNLLVAFNNLTGTWNSGLTGMVFSADSEIRAMYVRQDTGAYDPYNPTFSATSTTAKRNVVMFDITASSGPTPVPTGEFGVTPANEFALLDRPVNGWTEPFTVRIYNGGEPTTIEASLSGSYAENPFYMVIDGQEVMEIPSMTLETGDAFDFDIVVNPNAAPGDYSEEFTLFYATTGRDIMTIPVTATLYSAVAPDIVEVPGMVTWSGDSFTDTPIDFNANYNLYGMTEMKPDVVYRVELANDYRITASGGDDFIAIYNVDDVAELTAAVEPVLLGTSGIIDDEILLAGNYYMVIASNNITDVTINRVEIPAPEAITYIAPSPANGAMEVNAPVTLKWEGGANATEYQVLFGTVYPPTIPVLDWTMVDENYGTYVVSELASSTQYFWQIKARNSKGTVEGEVRGFTTTLTAPTNVTASETEIFTDESTLIKWKMAGVGGGFTGEITVADGTETSSYIPVYGLWMDDYTRSEMIYPAEMLEEMDGGEITSLTYYISSAATGPWTGDVFNVYMMEVDGTTLSSYYGSANAEIVYTGALDGQGGGTGTMVITLDNPYTYTGGNLLVGIEEIECGTYKSCYFYGVTATGASASGYSSSSLAAVTFNQRDFLPKTTFTCGGRGYQPVETRSFLGFNLYYGVKNAENVYEYTKVNTDLITEKQYLLDAVLPYNMEGNDIKVTAVWDEGESGHSQPNPCLVYVSGYGKFTGHVNERISGAPVANATVKFTGRDEFNNSVSFQGTTNASGLYTINNVKAGNYTGIVTLDGMEPAFSAPVTLAYNTTETVDFLIHEVYKPVLSVYAEEIDPTMSKVTWSLNTTISGGGIGGGSGDEFFENFDNSSMPAGWTTVDADGDGRNWAIASTIMSTGYGHNASTDCILSQSYDNNTGVLYPDNYLVTPQVAIGGSSTFSFYACAQDASYAAEHFGVAVSTTGTAASDFTMVQEWTMTAKGSGVMAPGRDGQMRAQGNWYQKTVDLSSYAGQNVYIAIRHFNCSDMFYLDVDDIELSAGSKDRAVENYTVVRKAILKETGVTPADSVMLVEGYTDTIYADVHWADMEPGLYQYGVSAHYPIPTKGNRAEIVFDFEDGSIPSEFTTTGSYPWIVVNGNGGKVMKSSNGGVASSSSTISLTYDYPTDGTFSFDAECMGEGTSTFWDKCTFSIDGVQQFQYGANMSGWHNYSYDIEAGEHTFTWDYTKDSSVNPTGDYFMVDNVTINYQGGGASNDDPITPLTWSNILPKDMEAAVTVNAHMATGSPEGAGIWLVNQVEPAFSVSAELDEAGTVSYETFRKGEYILKADLSDFDAIYDGNVIPEDGVSVSIWSDTTLQITFEEIYRPVNAFTVSGTGFAMWSDMLPEPERVAERYHVTLENIFQGETTDNFMQLNVENLTVGETYTAAVAVVYTTGMSDFVTTNFVYTGCEATATQVEDLEGHAECMNVVLTWNGGVAPNPNPNPNPNPGPTTGTTYDFDNGLQGWTTIDGGSPAGYGWHQGSTTLGTGNGHNGSADLVISQSYDNNYGVIYPDNYLISPAKGEYSQIKLWACGQDANYAAEHFGVAVSTGNATAADFTMVQEWTIGSKGERYAGPRGQRAQSTWTEYTVDLSAYAGQEIWVAVRHFNCSDMFYIDVDDITLSVPEKSFADAETCGVHTTTTTTPSRDMWDFVYSFNAAEGGQYGVACDGEFFYTSNWGYTSAAHNFYKYDLQGNMIEGFEIAGCGTLRGMTYDGQYFYGVANSSTIYCVDLANHALISTTNSAYGAMRAITYDPQRDGFWVVGNWSGNLTLVDRTGAIVQAGPAPESASDVAYYKDDEGVEHVYCFNNGDNGVYDYIIGNTSMGSMVFNYQNCPGFQSGASSGGCTVANYNGKACFIGDVQQSPNLIGIYELGAAQGGGGSASSSITPGKFNIFKDGEVIGATNDPYYTYEAEDIDEHLYEVYYVDANYNFSCAVEGVIVAAGTLEPVTNLTAEFVVDPAEGPGMLLTWEGNAESYDVYCQGQLLGNTTDTEAFISGFPADGDYTFGVVAKAGDCESEMETTTGYYDDVNESNIVNAIYPNPTSDNLTIKAIGMTRVSVINALGQVMYDAEVNADEVILNMGQYNAGIYMVNIVTVNGTTVKRVVVTK